MPKPRDWSTYRTETPERLQWRLGTVCAELADAHEEYAMVDADRLRAKTQALMTDADTEAARTRLADYAALEPASERILIQGRVNALIEERDYLRGLLNA